MKTVKRILVLALVVALAVTLAACKKDSKSDTQFLVMGTGGTTGTYYAFGSDIAGMWTGKVAGVQVDVESTGGSKANIVNINDGKNQLATIQNDVAYYAYQGSEDFDGKVIDSFSAIAALYPEAVQIVVAADSDIRSISDLRGRQVAIGAVGSGVYFNAIQVLALAGLTEADIEPQYLSFNESATAFQNRQIEACFITSGVPNASIIDIATKFEVRLLTLSEEEMTKLTEQYPFYMPVTVPAGTYNGMTEDVSIPAVMAVMVCANSLSEDTVYQLTKTLFEQKDALTHDKKNGLSPEAGFSGVSINFHPGALKYYQEVGLYTPAK